LIQIAFINEIEICDMNYEYLKGRKRMKKGKKAIWTIILLLVFSYLLRIQIVVAIPTFVLKANEGDWTEYEAKISQNYAMYDNINKTYIPIKTGDRIKYVLKGKVYSAFRGPFGGEFCYLQYPICDIYINNNKTSENEILTFDKKNMPPFLPVETKEDSYYYFWEDIDRYYQYWENASKILHFPYPNYTFVIEKDIVTIIIVDNTEKTNVSAIYDKDTGVLRSLYLKKTNNKTNVEFYMIIIDTNIKKALLPTPPWYTEYWYIWILVTIIVIYAVFSLKNKLKKKLESY